MLIQCTKKLLDQLNIKPTVSAEEELLFSWHANLIRVNRRKTIVLVNDKNRYVIVLYGLKAQDFNKLDEHIIQAIRETLQEEFIKDEIIEQFINHSPEVIYTKTKGRSTVAKMNKACELVYGSGDLMLEGFINQSAVNMRASRFVVGDGPNKYVRPSEELYKDLEAFAGKPIFSCKAVELKVTLALEKHNVWRRLVVPVNTTFNKLHQILQAAFGWQNYHLHEFYIYGDDTFDNDAFINHSGYHREGYRPIINLVCDEEAFYYDNDVPMKLEVGIKLSEYIPAKMKYNYDFGDNWQHYIEVARVIDDYDINYPVCLEGEGNTPPEDVGGEYGYEEFLKIMADEKHPKHEHMSAWGAHQRYKDFDIEMVNRLIKFNYRI